ncbi:hypothetical protein PG997_000785 [Apiospora hydei]|uniref:Uncharacterized protein n=1 Tax=Apiospora hydei TaxID=1337664 RepID=A0ABR1XBN0_9PEZI
MEDVPDGKVCAQVRPVGGLSICRTQDTGHDVGLSQDYRHFDENARLLPFTDDGQIREFAKPARAAWRQRLGAVSQSHTDGAAFQVGPGNLDSWETEAEMASVTATETVKPIHCLPRREETVQHGDPGTSRRRNLGRDRQYRSGIAPVASAERTTVVLQRSVQGSVQGMGVGDRRQQGPRKALPKVIQVRSFSLRVRPNSV